jgi:hypothetical protein
VSATGVEPLQAGPPPVPVVVVLPVVDVVDEVLEYVVADEVPPVPPLPPPPPVLLPHAVRARVPRVKAQIQVTLCMTFLS